MKYLLDGIIVEARQWFKDGDHPAVKRFEWPGHTCPVCDREHVGHGFVGHVITGRILCPGDWIVIRPNGKVWGYSQDEFKDAVLIEDGYVAAGGRA